MKMKQNEVTSMEGGKIFLALLALGGVLAGCSTSSEVIEARSQSGAGALEMAVRSETDVIKVGDQLEFSVWGYPEFQTTAVVRESGTIAIPLVGDVTAIGLKK